MAESKTVSVIIVNYNCGEWLAQCVQRVLASTVPVEVVVADNGSRDGSVEGLEQALGGDARVRVLRNGANLGFAKANNLALPHVSAPYLLFLNPDCLVEPDTLERMRTVLELHMGAGMAGCLVRNLDGSEQPGSVRRLPSPWRSVVRVLHLNRLFPRSPLFRDFVVKAGELPTGVEPVEGISGAFMLVRREALEEVGTLDEAYFLHCEDLDWFYRFQEQGWDVLFDPETAVTHVKGACSGSRPLLVLWHKHRGMVRFYNKFLRDSYPLPLLWLVIGAVWLRFLLLMLPAALRGVRP